MRRSAGFALLALLIAIAIMGLALASTAEIWATHVKREKELELLQIGAEFRRAIQSYAVSSPGSPEYPRSLQELVLDPRFPNTRRHLRRIYADPFTGKPDWGLIRSGDGIVGVHSLATGKPLKVAGFDPDMGISPGASRYSDWLFAYRADNGAPRVSGGSPTVGNPDREPGRNLQMPEDGNPLVEGQGRSAMSPDSGKKAPCQATLSETSTKCAESADPNEQSACLQAAILEHQRCLETN
ncbi:MAG TPA: type II secretion system protein [Burkholderiales bacterium]|nr:type II secretion system protein [Burkholderiales bacterium]